MNKEEFAKYCDEHVIVGVVPDTHEISIRFMNGESVLVYSDYDGVIHYRHSDEPQPDSKELFRQLREQSPDFIEKMIKKYSQ